MSATTTLHTRPLRRRSALLVVFLSFLLLVATVAATLLTPAVTQARITQPAGAAGRAAVTLIMGAGVLELGALPAGDTLLAGTLDLPSHEEVVQEVAHSGATTSVVLTTRARRPGWPPGWRTPVEALRWELGLSPALPLDLAIRLGVGDAQLDLAELQVERLDVRAGIGDTALTLPGQGSFRAVVEGGTGDTVIHIPAGVAARVTAQSGLGPVTLLVDGQRERLPYIEPGYATAANRVDLTVRSGVGTIRLHAGT
jgi:hypothetical protein